MVNWPSGGLDSLPRPGANTNRDDPGYKLHDVIGDLSTLIERLEARWGSDSGSTTPNALHKTPKALGVGASGWGYYSPVKLDEVGPLGTAQANIDFTSINQNFRSLYIDFLGRGAAAATSVGVWVRINNDSGANYDYQQILGLGATASGAEGYSQAKFIFGTIAAGSSFATFAGGCRIQIPHYTGSTFNKIVRATTDLIVGTSAGSIAAYDAVGNWRGTPAAVTRVTILPSTGNWDVGTIASLYGMP